MSLVYPDHVVDAVKSRLASCLVCRRVVTVGTELSVVLRRNHGAVRTMCDLTAIGQAIAADYLGIDPYHPSLYGANMVALKPQIHRCPTPKVTGHADSQA